SAARWVERSTGSRANRIQAVLLTNVELHARECKRAGHVVDDVHLTGVEAWRQRRGRDVELEDGALAIGRSELGGLDERRLEGAYFAAEERDARQHLDRVGRRRARGGSRPAPWIV